MLKKYLKIYGHIFLFRLKIDLAYRLNYFIKIFYGPAYLGVMLLLVETAFSHAHNLGGLNQNEGILLYSIFSLLYALSLMIYVTGIKHFLWSGLRMGELDYWLVKPLNPQFLANFSFPNTEQIPLILLEAGLFFRQLYLVRAQVTLFSLLVFLASIILASLILYFTLSTYQTLGFYATKAPQVVEILDKATDFANYPTSIFPNLVKITLFTLIPIAFTAYVPTLFLLNRGNLWLFLSEIVLLIILYYLNQFAWQAGLKRYSSASS